MQRGSAAAAITATLLSTSVARAATRSVGPSQAYATPCDAVAAAQPGDEIDIAPGTYTDSCSITVASLTLRGVGGRPKIDLSGTDHPAQYKGIYVIDADDVTIENLELTGAHISDTNGANGAGLRVEATGLTVRGCDIHDNQDGILGGTTGTITIERTEFFNNGLGRGCDLGGCTHNVYISNIDTLYFRFNWSHHIATDTPNKGHLLKSRAKANYVLYNRITGEDGFDSYEIDLPNGGLAIVVGNEIEKGAASGNSTLLAWGEEGATNADKRVYVVSNTFVNDFTGGTFMGLSGATLVAHDNLLVGPGKGASTGSLSADNLSAIYPLFVDRRGYDYHLDANSPAIGKAVDPGMADQFSLVATSEYAQPADSVARTSAHDVGAFEYAASGPGTADAGTGDEHGGVAAMADASRGTVDSGGGRALPGDGGSPAGDGGANGGCGCTVGGSQVTLAVRLGGWGWLALAWVRRSRRRGGVS